jgi:hypothetical protein
VEAVPDEIPVAVVHLELDPSQIRGYQLPGSGSRSLLYVFDGQQVGASAETRDGSDLTPGSSHEGVRLTFWDPAALTLVRPGAAFDVWYGGVVGRGAVDHLDGGTEPRCR